jgi:hypothetical protein
MGRGKRRAPVWLQYLIVWIVVSGLGASGLMFLRSRGVVSDAIFQPLVPVLCDAGSRLETAYSSRESTVDRQGRTSQTGRQQTSTGLDRATCVAPDGRTTAVTGGLTALVLALGGAAGALLVALLVLVQRR